MENEEVVQEGERKMLAAGVTGPEGHAQAHIEEAESEAVMRAAVIANQVNNKKSELQLLLSMTGWVSSSAHQHHECGCSRHCEGEEAERSRDHVRGEPGVSGVWWSSALWQILEDSRLHHHITTNQRRRGG